MQSGAAILDVVRMRADLVASLALFLGLAPGVADPAPGAEMGIAAHADVRQGRHPLFRNVGVLALTDDGERLTLIRGGLGAPRSAHASWRPGW